MTAIEKRLMVVLVFLSPRRGFGRISFGRRRSFPVDIPSARRREVCFVWPGRKVLDIRRSDNKYFPPPSCLPRVEEDRVPFCVWRVFEQAPSCVKRQKANHK